ncbi:hypothetical protein McanMca71_004993 [Microsporum canis]
MASLNAAEPADIPIANIPVQTTNDENISKLVVIQVGEGRYHTTVETLTEKSNYFKAYFSGKWTIPMMEDGSIFIDADSSTFEHVLRYLRRGVFPLAFDATKGHDYRLYASILEEARYFQCPELVTWLEDQCYHKCVTWRVSTENSEYSMEEDSSVGDLCILPSTTAKKLIYNCPRGITVHRGQRERCGRQCRNAQLLEDINYDVEYITSGWLVSKKRYTFNSGWMTAYGSCFVDHMQKKAALPIKTLQ